MPWTTDESGNRFERYSHSAVAANATNNSDAISIAAFSAVSIQVVHASHSDTSTWALQSSNDATNWDTISGSSTTTSGASGSATLVISPVVFRQIRLTITETDAGASSTLTPYIVATKGNK